MNTSTDNKAQGITIQIITLAALMALGTTAQADFQQNVLFAPSESILNAEAKGRVMIYDGLQEETVYLAMTQQFDRIENMMFVATVIEQDDGELAVEEDGCD